MNFYVIRVVPDFITGEGVIPCHKDSFNDSSYFVLLLEEFDTTVDLIAQDGKNYLIGECKWQNEKVDCGVLIDLREKAEVFNKNREKTWFVLFSKSGFTKSLMDAAKKDPYVLLYDLQNMFE